MHRMRRLWSWGRVGCVWDLLQVGDDKDLSRLLTYGGVSNPIIIICDSALKNDQLHWVKGSLSNSSAYTSQLSGGKSFSLNRRKLKHPIQWAKTNVPTLSLNSFVNPSEMRNCNVSSANMISRFTYRNSLFKRKSRKSFAMRMSLSIFSDCLAPVIDPTVSTPACWQYVRWWDLSAFNIQTKDTFTHAIQY